MSPIRLAILASGSGSNAETICTYFSKRPDVEICLVVSNNADAFVHQRAKQFGVESITLTKTVLADSELFLAVLKKYRIDFVVLAGYMVKIPQGIVQAFPNRMVNIHPSLLPKFGGKGMFGNKVHQAVVEARETQSGISIHLVNENYDEGSIVFQATCPVLPGDLAEDVAKKVHQLEYLHYPKVIDQILLTEFGSKLEK